MTRWMRLAGLVWLMHGSATAAASATMLVDVQGARVSVDTILHKGPALLWFTNLCDNCQAAIPALDALTRTLAGTRVSVTGVSFIPGDRDRVAALLHERKPAFPILLDPGGAVTERFTGVKPEDICPVVNAVMLDAKGRVIFRGHYPGTDPAELERRLREAARKR